MESAEYTNAILSLLLIIGAITLLGYALKRFAPGMALHQRGTKRMKLLEVLPLGARQKAMILRCDNREHIIIVSDTNSTILETRTIELQPEAERHEHAA